MQIAFANMPAIDMAKAFSLCHQEAGATDEYPTGMFVEATKGRRGPDVQGAHRVERAAGFMDVSGDGRLDESNLNMHVAGCG